MARKEGSLKLSSNIEPRAAAPLDAREKVALKSDLTATGTFPYPYEGMEVYVVEEKKKYVLIGDDPTVSENWQEVGSGGDVIEYVETLPTGNNIQNKIYNAKTEGEISLPIIESLNHDKVIKYYEGFLTSEEIGGIVPVTEFYPKEGISISRFIKIRYVWHSDVVNYVSIEAILPGNVTYNIGSYSKTDTDYPRYLEQEFTFEYATNDKYYAGDNTNQTLTKLAKQENASNIFTGTHSEWDAMSIIKKQEYDYAAFTDDESGTPDYYSTSEVKTNKVWIDGKPIYRKVYSGIMPSSIISSSRQEFVLINETSTDKEDLVNVGGYFDLWDSRDYLRRYNTNTAFPTADLKIQLGFVCGLVNGKLTASAYTYDADYYRVTSSCKFNIVVEYTKTTD